MHPYNIVKLQFRSTKCTYLGFSSDHKGYRCLNSEGRVFISRDVLFDESSFPFSSSISSSNSSSSYSSIPSLSPSIPLVPTVASNISNATINTNHTCSSASPLMQVSSPNIFVATDIPDPFSSPNSSSSSSTRYLLPPPSPLITAAPQTSNTHHMLTRSKRGIHKPKSYMVTQEPHTVKVALTHPKWKLAMTEEYNALIKNHTWDLVSLPAGKTPIGCKCVFKLKQNPNGTVNRYKARLMAKGFHQVPGFDFSDIFSPVIKPVTIRVVLSHVISCGWSVRKLDINNAFLNGNLVEEVFMLQPEGLSKVILLLFVS